LAKKDIAKMAGKASRGHCNKNRRKIMKNEDEDLVQQHRRHLPYDHRRYELSHLLWLYLLTRSLALIFIHVSILFITGSVDISSNPCLPSLLFIGTSPTDIIGLPGKEDMEIGSAAINFTLWFNESVPIQSSLDGSHPRGRSGTTTEIHLGEISWI
jgi:hypothetical protein